jgi:hypothetical protein
MSYPFIQNIISDEKIPLNQEINIYENKKNFTYKPKGNYNNNPTQKAYQTFRKDNESYIKNNNFSISSKNFQENKQYNNSENLRENNELRNYNHLIQYLEKYKELNDRLIETLENEKNDVKIDMNKRKRDVENLEHILNYISSFGDNKETKDFIPFYLIDKRKLFENMVKYLYSKDEMTHSFKHKNVRLYKIHNKLK